MPQDPPLPDPTQFKHAMENVADNGRPDVAVRAAETLHPVGPEDEVRSDPEAPTPPPPPPSPPTGAKSGPAVPRR